MQPTIADTTQPVTTHADATPTDIPRPDAPSRNGDVTVPHEALRHSLSLDQVGNIYAERGFPRSARSLQRFCAGGHLDCEKVATTTGDKYLVAPYSVERHLKQLAQLAATEAATRPDMARQAATPVGVAVGAHDGPDGVRRSCGLNETDVLRSCFRNMSEYVGRQIAMRIDETEAGARAEILRHERQEQRRFTRSRGPDDIEMTGASVGIEMKGGVGDIDSAIVFGVPQTKWGMVQGRVCRRSI
jgi:hypothetical protein